jgi:hypothetical protein
MAIVIVLICALPRAREATVDALLVDRTAH